MVTDESIIVSSLFYCNNPTCRTIVASRRCDTIRSGQYGCQHFFVDLDDTDLDDTDLDTDLSDLPLALPSLMTLSSLLVLLYLLLPLTDSYLVRHYGTMQRHYHYVPSVVCFFLLLLLLLLLVLLLRRRRVLRVIIALEC